MTKCTLRTMRWLGVAAVLGLVGCNKNDAPPVTKVADQPAVAVTPAEKVAVPAPKAVEAQPVSAALARLHQPFKDAVLLEPPVNDELLENVTSTGKKVAQIFETIAGKDNQGGLWDQIRFAEDAGRPLTYQVVFTTAAGEIALELYPQDAPNHCRSFIALAKTGYFDGMPFYYSMKSKADEQPIAFIESGSPKGTSQVGYGSIGYWLKPEIEGNKRKHEAGAVGAYHREERETAACRFYIAAEAMPQMDGEFTIFGKVVRGLDVVRTINARPVGDDNRLKEPVLIQKAVVVVN